MPDGKKLREKTGIPEKDENLLKEIKRIKRLQRGLYQEYEIPEIEEEAEDDS